MPAARQKAKEQPSRYKELGNRGIWQLIRKGLSGREAALLWIADSWEVDHDREGFLSDKNLERLEKAVKFLSPTEAEVYQKYTYAYRLLDYTLLEAGKKSLEVSEALHKYIFFMTREYFKTARSLLGAYQKLLELHKGSLSDAQIALQKVAENAEQEELKSLEGSKPFVSRVVKSTASFQAYVEVIRAAGKVMELPVKEDIELFWENIKEASANLGELYEMMGETNKFLETTGALGSPPPGLPGLSFPDIKADPEELDYLQERIAMAFGERWMEEGPDIAEEEEGLDLEEEWEDLYGQ